MKNKYEINISINEPEPVNVTSNTNKTIRYRLNVPENDVSVVKWIQEQNNVSISIRQIIREYIAKNGYGDTLCTPIKPITNKK